MPSKSPAQHRMMEAAAHDPKFAKKAGVPQKVAKEYAAADKSSGNMGGGKPADPMGGGSKKPGSGPMGGKGAGMVKGPKK